MVVRRAGERANERRKEAGARTRDMGLMKHVKKMVKEEEENRRKEEGREESDGGETSEPPTTLPFFTVFLGLILAHTTHVPLRIFRISNGEKEERGGRDPTRPPSSWDGDEGKSGIDLSG